MVDGILPKKSVVLGWAYEAGVLAAVVWVAWSIASTISVVVFAAVNFAALLLFDNHLVRRMRALPRPFDSGVGLIIQLVIGGFPIAFILGAQAPLASLFCVAVLIGTRLLLRTVSPDERVPRLRNRGDRVPHE